MRDKTKRMTIGLLVSGIMDDYTEYICKGVRRAAIEEKADVIVFPGKYIDRDLSENKELRYEYQYHTIFTYAKNRRIDALIIAADCIGCFTSQKRIMEMLGEYHEFPCILVASKKEGYAGVIFDNYQGIKDGLEYLIHGCGCKKFAMIGGSAENVDAAERKQAFVSVLEANGIPVEDKMFAEGNLTRRSGDVFATILDRNPDVEAVFCVNDDTAMGLYDELRKRGKRAGRDIAVLGYDDTVESAHVSPPLASVRADSAWLGEEAVHMACAAVRGERVESKVLPTKFIKRESISDSMAHVNKDDFYRLEDFDVHFDEIFHRSINEEKKEQMIKIRVAYKRLMMAFVRNAMKGFKNPRSGEEIAFRADEFINTGGVKYADVDILLSHLESAYKVMRSMQIKDEGRTELRDLFFDLYRKTVRAMNVLVGDMEQEKIKESYDMKVFVQDILQFEKGKDQSYGVLLERLEWLGIKNAKLYMLKHPELHLFKEAYSAPETLYLKAERRDGVVRTVPAMQQKTDFDDIYTDRAGQSSYRVVLPLFSDETIYGILLCDMTDALHDNGELLVNQMSAAVKMLKLLEANEMIQQQLEDNLATLKDSNIKLDTLSKSDVLTGIYNRRGFYDVTQQMIDECSGKQQPVLAVYVDMNNLKIINDRYGHEEGDHSLKLIGTFLKEMVAEQGVAGRIGGDEYAFAIAYDGNDGGEAVMESLYHKFEVYNENSDKDYNITVSAGACVIQPGQQITLKEALQQADERLYLVKQKRKKDVAKHH
ncbi:MAG: GGDEF domain-containing protein [Lachnospiraceae bacterium]|nr:GGDEF domain-containing protein [Lachnospiraceae bacterium]